tara:strand:- start:905 stop:2218 length:1314 start_codon:yes stop_codon:yes gene_type:complete
MSISIVIPIGHKDQNFKIIDQIKEKFKEYEVIVVSSYQNTEAKTLEEKVDQFLSIHNSSRAKAMNAGAEIAQNEMLWFLHLDSDLSLISSIDLEEVDNEKINTFLLRFNNEKLKYNSIGANLRTKYLKLPFGDQSFLINKKLFNFLGEFTEGLEKGEDHEFIWKTKQLGIKINIIDNYILTSGIKYNANPIYQTLKTLKDTVIQILKFYKPKSKYVICHFLKDPKSKKSKTRLREQLEDDFVDKLNENLIEILTDNIKKLKTNRSIYQLTVSEKIHEKYAHQFSKITNGLYLTSQKDLGLSMKEVIDFNLRYFKKVVIVGSDIPLLTAQDIKDSLKNFSAKNIFYPTLDGGFCLLATSDKKILDIIDKVKYGTDTVLIDLTKNIRKLLIENKFYQDIDVKEDLEKVYQSLKDKVYSLNSNLKKLYTLLYSNRKKFTE